MLLRNQTHKVLHSDLVCRDPEVWSLTGWSFSGLWSCLQQCRYFACNKKLNKHWALESVSVQCGSKCPLLVNLHDSRPSQLQMLWNWRLNVSAHAGENRVFTENCTNNHRWCASYMYHPKLSSLVGMHILSTAWCYMVSVCTFKPISSVCVCWAESSFLYLTACVLW